MSSENSKNSKRQPRIIRASSLSSSAHRAVSENVSIDARDELRIRTKRLILRSVRESNAQLIAVIGLFA